MSTNWRAVMHRLHDMGLAIKAQQAALEAVDEPPEFCGPEAPINPFVGLSWRAPIESTCCHGKTLGPCAACTDQYQREQHDAHNHIHKGF